MMHSHHLKITSIFFLLIFRGWGGGMGTLWCDSRIFYVSGYKKADWWRELFGRWMRLSSTGAGHKEQPPGRSIHRDNLQEDYFIWSMMVYYLLNIRLKTENFLFVHKVRWVAYLTPRFFVFWKVLNRIESKQDVVVFLCCKYIYTYIHLRPPLITFEED